MRPIAFALPALCLLGACATPQQQCVATATHDLVVVNHLVAQLQVDIDRGYGMKQSQIVTPMWRPCFGHGGWGDDWDDPHGHHHARFTGPDLCLDDNVQTVSTPVAIDLAQARQTLAELKRKQAELNREAGPAIAQCQALYPK